MIYELSMYCVFNENLLLFWFQLFRRLKHEVPKFYHKVSVVNGNLEQPGFGLSDEDKQKLSDEVNIIFHSAATVRFDEKLNIAVGINVLGTREILKLAKTVKNLKVTIFYDFSTFECGIFQGLCRQHPHSGYEIGILAINL